MCLFGSEAEEGVGVRVCFHRPCTPRVGNLYSVTWTPESPGVRATECKSLVAHKILLDSILLLSTAPFPAEQCACLSLIVRIALDALCQRSPIGPAEQCACLPAVGGVGVSRGACLRSAKYQPCTPRVPWGNQPAK